MNHITPIPLPSLRPGFIRTGAALLILASMTGTPVLAQSWTDITANLPVAPKVGVGQSLASDGSALYVLASTNGVLRSTDNGATWSAFHAVSGGGHDLSQFGSRGLDATGTTLWAGGEPGGAGFSPLHKTTAPAAWSASFSGAPPPPVVDAVAFDSSTNTHWAAGRLGGIYKSTNDGSTWSQANGNIPGTNCASIIARNGKVIAAITGSGMGAFTSTDGGLTWKNNGVPLPQPGFLTAAGDSVCIAGTGDTPLTTGIYFSRNFGLTWQFTQVDTAGGMKLLTNNCSDSTTMFSGGTEVIVSPLTYLPKAAFSLNGGTTWDDITAPGLPTGIGKQVERLCRHGTYLFALTGDLKLYRLDLSAVTLTPALKIAVAPKPNKQLTGGTLTMKVYAGGPGVPGYQWKKDNIDVPGQTADTFSITNAQPSDTGNYTCVVTAGVNSVTSAVARGTVVDRIEGRYDPTYGRANMAGSETGTPFLQADGSLIVGASGGVYKLGPNGGKTDSRTISSAGTGGRLVDSSGRVLLAGGSNSGNQRVRRLLGGAGFPDDPAFPLLAANSTIVGIVEEPGVGYLVFGSFTGISPASPLSYVTVPKIARVNYSGTIDATFNSALTTTLGSQGGVAPSQMFVDGSGFIWLVYGDRVLKLTSAGSPAAGFTPYISLSSADNISSSRLLSSGKLLVTLATSSTRPLKLIKSDGAFDSAFNTANHALMAPFSIAVEQADGKIIIGGAFGGYGPDTFTSRYMRISAQGVLDTTFYNATGFNGPGCTGMVYDPRGYVFMASSTNSSTLGAFQDSSTIGDTIGQNFARVFATAAAVGGTSYASWASGISFPVGKADPDDDADNDGFINLEEFAFGSNPLNGSGTQGPEAGAPAVIGPDTYPTIAYNRRTDAAGITISVQADGTIPMTGAYPTSLVSTTPLGGGLERVVHRSNVSLASDTSQFLRLRISGP